MIDNDAIDQYSTDDIPVQNTVKSNTIKRSNFISDVKVGDQNFSMIDPNYIEFMNNRINKLENTCRQLENEIRTLRQSVVRKDIEINRVIAAINSRFNLNG